MTHQNAIQIFEGKKVRTLWDEDQQKWYLSIVDVIAVLTDSPNPRKYWSVLKPRLKAEGSQLATNCSQLKMQSADGKFYRTDVADTEQLFILPVSVFAGCCCCLVSDKQHFISRQINSSIISISTIVCYYLKLIKL